MPARQAPTPRRLDVGQASGLTPVTKRPLNRESIQVANTGERPLSHDELTSGFYALLRRADREEAFTLQLSQCVTENAGILSEVGKRSAENRVAVELLTPKVEQMEAEIAKNLLSLQNNLGETIVDFD